MSRYSDDGLPYPGCKDCSGNCSDSCPTGIELEDGCVHVWEEYTGAYEKYKSKGFTIFQVSLDKTREAWLQAIAKDGLGKWQHASDLKFWNCVPAKLYHVQSIPSNFLLDKDGKILAVNLRGAQLEAKLEELLK